MHTTECPSNVREAAVKRKLTEHGHMVQKIQNARLQRFAHIRRIFTDLQTN